jgi:hypothetical protein
MSPVVIKNIEKSISTSNKKLNSIKKEISNKKKN